MTLVNDWCSTTDAHRIVESDDHRFQVGRTRCGVADVLKRLRARASGIVERAVATLQARYFHERDVTGGGFVANQDDVDIVVAVLCVAVVVVDAFISILGARWIVCSMS
jgi:hypothetical protein